MTRIVAALLIGCLSLLFGRLAHANEPSTITATGELTSDRIIVTGNLSSTSGPVANVEILGEVNEEWYYVDTDTDGNFEMHLDRPSGDAQSYEVQLVFEEQGDFEASELRITVGAAAPQTLELVIEASLDTNEPRPDSLVGINGTVTGTDGTAMDARQVDAAFNGNEQEASTTFTDDAGSFMTFVEIPADEPQGEAQIVLSTPETADHGSASLTLTVTVGERLASPPPAEDSDTEADAGNEASPEPAVEEETAEPRETHRSTPAYHSGPWDWFWAIIVVAGGTALLVTFFLIIRGILAKRGREVDDANLLGDGGMLASQFGPDDEPVGSDELPEPPSAPAEASEGADAQQPRPRRALPE